MSTAEELTLQLETYQAQLTQINAALAFDENNEDMNALKGNLEELITLTQQNIEESLPTTKCKRFQLGDKCQAPFLSKSNGCRSYHNAVIFSDEDKSDEEIVRVVFSNPTEVAMAPCPYFIEGRCKFSDKCKYSHGEMVAVSELKDFVPIAYEQLKEGSSVLAKADNSLLWEYAKIDMICGDEYLVKWQNNRVESLPMQAIFPLKGDFESDSDLNVPSNLDFNDSLNIDNEDMVLQIDPYASRLGAWEAHTKGIGSKLLMKMGYVMGTGLNEGKGRVEPVPTVVYPTGKSLDWCMDHHHEKKDGIKVPKKKAKESKATNKATNMFDIVNAACSSKQIEKKGLDKESNDTLQVQSFKISQNVEKIKQEIVHLEQSAARHQGKDHSTYSAIQSKIRSKKEYLKKMQDKSNVVQMNKDKERERKRLTIF